MFLLAFVGPAVEVGEVVVHKVAKGGVVHLLLLPRLGLGLLKEKQKRKLRPGLGLG